MRWSRRKYYLLLIKIKVKNTKNKVEENKVKNDKQKIYKIINKIKLVIIK